MFEIIAFLKTLFRSMAFWALVIAALVILFDLSLLDNSPCIAAPAEVISGFFCGIFVVIGLYYVSARI